MRFNVSWLVLCCMTFTSCRSVRVQSELSNNIDASIYQKLFERFSKEQRNSSEFLNGQKLKSLLCPNLEIGSAVKSKPEVITARLEKGASCVVNATNNQESFRLFYRQRLTNCGMGLGPISVLFTADVGTDLSGQEIFFKDDSTSEVIGWGEDVNGGFIPHVPVNLAHDICDQATENWRDNPVRVQLNEPNIRFDTLRIDNQKRQEIESSLQAGTLTSDEIRKLQGDLTPKVRVISSDYGCFDCHPNVSESFKHFDGFWGDVKPTSIFEFMKNRHFKGL